MVMRIIHGLLPSLMLVVAACGPTNSAQDPGPTWFRAPPAAVAEPAQAQPAPAIDPEPETPLERAAAKITDATKKPGKPAKPTKASKPKKSQRASTDTDSDDGDWDQQPAHETPPPPKKKQLPETGRHIGEECDQDSQCVSNDCTFDRCEHRTNTRMPKGEKCDYNNECESNNCYMDECQ
jgi:hypothetical protein